MRIANAFGGGPTVSFEFFPPRTPEAEKRLYETVERLAPLKPTWVSVTYGAGGATRRLTVDIVRRIKRESGIEALAHLTCVGHTAGELAEILDELVAGGIENVLALRGDPPRGQTVFTPMAGGFAHGAELAAFIRSKWNVCVAGAAHPETHIEAADPETDLRHLRAKVDAGAEQRPVRRRHDERANRRILLGFVHERMGLPDVVHVDRVVARGVDEEQPNIVVSVESHGEGRLAFGPSVIHADLARMRAAVTAA